MRKLLCLIVSLAFPAVLCAQVSVDNRSVERAGRSVSVSFDISTGAAVPRSRYKMILTPYLCHGGDTAWLAPVEVYGRVRYKRERQEQALAGNATWRLGPGQVMAGTPVHYTAEVPYAGWMRTASLGLSRRLVGCACDCFDGDQTVAADIPVYVAPTPFLAEIAPDPARYGVVDARRRWAFDGEEIRVFFPVSKTDLLPDRYGNRATLDKIVEEISKIGSADRLRLSGIEITGFASPEGALPFNARLGQGRAEALRAHIRSRLPELADDDFVLVNGVENWDGLRRMVAASDMDSRDAVLAIIDSLSGEARKRALKALDGRRSYDFMLRNFYPELRNACYVAVYYDVLGDTAADAINAAHAMIREGCYAPALEALLRHRDDDRAWNAIGVCYMMLEQEDEAAAWFERAIAAGNDEAARNLRQIR